MVHREGIRSLKIKRVTEYLLNVLLPLPYGGKLPGIRTIRKQTGAGQSIVMSDLRDRFRGFSVAEDFAEEPVPASLENTPR